MMSEPKAIEPRCFVHTAASRGAEAAAAAGLRCVGRVVDDEPVADGRGHARPRDSTAEVERPQRYQQRSEREGNLLLKPHRRRGTHAAASRVASELVAHQAARFAVAVEDAVAAEYGARAKARLHEHPDVVVPDPKEEQQPIGQEGHLEDEREQWPQHDEGHRPEDLGALLHDGDGARDAPPPRA
eukprot:scaffold42112_cov62-Phaeocystis_antarctica.AAC.4